MKKGKVSKQTHTLKCGEEARVYPFLSCIGILLYRQRHFVFVYAKVVDSVVGALWLATETRDSTSKQLAKLASLFVTVTNDFFFNKGISCSR